MSELRIKTTATDRLTQKYLRRLERENYIAAAITIFIATGSLLWLVFQFGGHTRFGEASVVTFFANSMFAVASAIGAIWCFETAYRARRGPVILEPRHQLAWLLIGLGLFSCAIGGAFYTYLEDYVQKNPVPSAADIGFTLFYIFTFIGLLLMPTTTQTRRSCTRIGLDALITTLCILSISWFFVIGPIFSSVTDRARLYTAVSYPFWDVLLILAIVLLVYQRTARLLYPSLIMCALGILSLIWADTLYAYTIPFSTYNTGIWYIDTFWFIGYLLIGLSAPYQYASIARRAYREHIQPTTEIKSSEFVAFSRTNHVRKHLFSLRNFLIFAPILVVIVLVLDNEISHAYNLVLVGLASSIGILLTTRYLLANNENEILLAEREQRRTEADLLRMITARLTQELQLDNLLTRIVTTATTELSFDAAALFLVEAYDQSPGAQFSLLIRASPADAPDKTITWRLEGEHITYRTILTGKQVEVFWQDHSVELPAEVYSWQREQSVLSTLFVPLIYQEKILGSLGFSSRTPRRFSERDSYLANAYAEQAAIAIEHAHLYEDAREHELFAQALTRVAARLNSAVTTGSGVGAEIYQLICTEGARALQADYAILYLYVNDEQLNPMAVFCNTREPASLVNDWPPIRSRETEAQALYSSQPTLIEIDDMATSSGRLPAVTGPLRALPAPGTTSSAQQRPSNTLPLQVPSGGLRFRKKLTLRNVLARRKVQTAILAPLMAGNSQAALLVLARSSQHASEQKRPFARADIGHAQAFAEQAAIAFTNAQLYQKLHDAHHQLQELDQLKDQFMITASHELRTPLTSVQGYLELLVQFGASLPSEQQQEFLQKAQRACDELVLLLSNVMDTSRLEIEAGIRPAHFERVILQEVISDVITLIEPQVTHEKREVYLYLPGQIAVKADPPRLRQVLLNLSMNALKYSKTGTPIAFAARTFSDSRPCAILSVSDKGKGIKPQDQAQVFERFVRLESDLNSTVRGSGLGLYISRRLIEAMDGKIWVESSGIPGMGSTFHIQLPLA
ncbi:MAG: GAF domain-containing sensor histidine kinase [Chloroflexi bacterium]|nr:MAG: GAF domain-containing sensor histidine kinase [Chloroflexota bacterium]